MSARLPKRGLEPLLLLELEPKPSMSTNSTILAIYSLPDLNRYSYKNQILSLTCLPIPPSERSIMAQFDLVIIFNVVWSLSLTLGFYYAFLIDFLLPNFFETKKFRFKKLKG
jgi:hypothetical protein